MAAPEEGTEPLRYQVRIHCEGCKKKVKKVLHSIEGVYKTDIDTQQQKVVVIGNVSADELVKKLLKTGKHAEPWPEPAPPPPADTGAPDGGSPGSGGGGGGGKKKKKKNKSKNPANSNPAEPPPAPADGGGPSPPDNAAACGEQPDGGEQDKPEGGGGGQPAAGDPHDDGQPAAMTLHGPPAANGNGGGGKRKGKNKGGGGGGNGNANNGNGDGGAIVEVHAPDALPTNQPGGGGPVDAGPVPYPPPPMSYPGYYGGHSPAYVMSYHAAHPSPALRSSAYYHPMVGAAYATGGGGGGGYFYSTAPVATAPGSYYMFSEENANACSVM
ncbi:hypothetical protein PR202_gb24866 [Eleusine coracana subsp. coracana]|uniref:HMA domain-containing protein n=1 Tax=Eleusine coracana subsp. coracana TaxID=191504 RepID=A0AAV5FM30_ELECO|nr:hypothetical protein PR202_gb24866 [Eleusine coracana subsp. coracana]